MVEQVGLPFSPGVLLATSFCVAVEWLFDRVRTTVNVSGDAVGVAIVDAIIQREKGRGLASTASVADAAVNTGGAGSSALSVSGNHEFVPASPLEQSVGEDGVRVVVT